MIVLVTYDISCNRNRTRLHKFLREFGLNTQKSVFECDLDPEGLARILNFVRRQIDPLTDSVRIYRLCARCLRKAQLSGRGMKLTQLDYMII
jgi:CRISPR-associated protein Cas2